MTSIGPGPSQGMMGGMARHNGPVSPVVLAPMMNGGGGGPGGPGAQQYGGGGGMPPPQFNGYQQPPMQMPMGMAMGIGPGQGQLPMQQQQPPFQQQLPQQQQQQQQQLQQMPMQSYNGNGYGNGSGNGSISGGTGGPPGPGIGQAGVGYPTRNGSVASSSSASAAAGASERDIRVTAEVHYRDLLNFLQSHLAKAQTRPRSMAREKLTRLSKQQFSELSTDVYDELVRRQKASASNNQSPGGPAPPSAIPPHLEVRPEFHPKRNQARQKLATLPKTRFKDLASDVFFELERRFPEFADKYRPEAAAAARRGANDQLDRDVAANMPPPLPTNSAYLNAMTNGAGAPPLPGEERSASKLSQNAEAKAEAVAAKKKKMAQLTAALGGNDFGGEDGGDSSHTNQLDAEEELDDGLGPDGDGDGDGDQEDGEEDGSRMRKTRGNKSSAARDTMDDRSTMYSQSSSIGTGFLNGYAGSSVAGGVGGSPALGREGAFSPSYGETVEKLRSDYEFRVAQLQSKCTALEVERDQAIRDAKDAVKDEREKMEQIFEDRLQDEISHQSQQHEERYEELQKQLQYTTSRLEFLTGEHNELLDRHRERDEMEVEYGDVARLREENETLQKECAKQEAMVNELKGEVSSLLDELRALSERNDEMIAEKDNDHIMIRELNSQLSNFKRKYESARSELRAFKATSQLFVQPVKIVDDDDENVDTKSSAGSELKRSESSVSRSMGTGPSWTSMLSDRGAIADVHMRAFQASIDELLASARSRVAGNVLMSMKTVVLAATLITDDVAKHENGGGSSLSSEDREGLQMLKTKSSAALSNLMTACRNYASSQGLSPVSLLDAAASHVSASVIDIVKLVRLRKASPKEQQELDATFGTGSDGLRTLQNGLKPLHIHAGIVSNSSASNPPSASFSNGERALPSSTASSSLNSKLNAVLPDVGDSPSLSASNSGVDGRFSPRGRAGSNMGRYSPVGYRPDATRKDSTGEGSWISGGAAAGAGAGAGPGANGGDAGAGADFAGSSLKARGAAAMRNLPTVAASRSSFQGSEAEDDPYMQVRSAAEEREENWAELRNYIKVQTDSIQHSIQNLLAAIREGAQFVQLTETLTQITTIVSSIVVISKENLPSLGAMGAVGASPATVARANEAQRILQELSANCDRLIEMQTRSSSKEDGADGAGGPAAPGAGGAGAAGTEGAGAAGRGVVFDKAMKSAMASASYGVAKGLKALRGLLDDVEAGVDDLR
ncbi:component of the polarisome [Tilletia horrida]|nr:component of the polarisome [Tilletia horrida]